MTGVQTCALPIFNLATFVVPPLLIWHLWDRLPYAFDALRNGKWSETGVPLMARYKVLAGILLISLIANFFLYTRFTSYRDKVSYQVSTATYRMYSELDQAAFLLTYRNDEAFADWLPRVVQHLNEYRNATRRVNQMVVAGSVAQSSQFYFLSDTIPEGIQGALRQTDTLETEDFSKIVVVIKAIMEGLEKYYSPTTALSPALYESIADHVLKAMQDSEAVTMFDVQYSPR